MPIHPRNEKYKNQVLSAPREICIERARYYTRSFKETEGEHPAIRAAKAFRHALENMSIYILPDELIAGNRTSKLVGTVIPVERGDINTVLEIDLDELTGRKNQPLHITKEDRKELNEEILPYWKGKTLRDRKKKLMKSAGIHFVPAMYSPLFIKHAGNIDFKPFRYEKKFGLSDIFKAFKGFREVLYNNPAMVTNVFDVQGHLILGDANVLNEGFAGIKSNAEKKLNELDPANGDGRAFLNAVVMCCNSMREFALRFAVKADEMAALAVDPGRRKSFERISAACRNVPFHAPRTFFEAVQSLWLTQVGGFIAYGMAGIFAVGRMDQYLYRFYKQDLDAGIISEDEAVELLEELMIKLSYNLLVIPALGKQTGSELGADSCAITIGGVDRQGGDSVNGLTYLILEAYENVKSLGNTFSIRLSEKNPVLFRRKALASYRKTSGAALFNDEIVVGALERCGYKTADARNYGVIGCVEPAGDGDTFGCTSGNDISLVAALEMTLLNGRLRIMGRRIGPETGDPLKFKTFDDFFNAYKRQVSFLVDMIAKAVNLKDQAYAEMLPNPYVSSTITGCVESAKDMTQGGAKYNFASMSGRGLGTTADSLAAVKHFIFSTKTLKMKDLLKALDDNFKGNEQLRLTLLSKGPKYGNDIDEADQIAKSVVEHFCTEVSKQRSIRGGGFRPGFFSYGMHVLDGLMLGATPNGRRAGEPVSNSFSPSNGAEFNGPTAVMNSVAKMPAGLISNGYALNMKFLPAFFEKEENLEKMTALVAGFFRQGGMELSPNVVSGRTLRDAQEHPEKHMDLVVRVSGYSAFFCDLGRPLQDEIIRRTEFSGC